MKRIAWLTDIHLNFLPVGRAERFLNEVKELSPDAIFLTGDISESQDVQRYLEMIAVTLQRPIYFVLGNHDFYFGSITNVRAQVRRLCDVWSNLNYLTISEALELAPDVGIVGHDGWADARIGDYERSLVMMNDYRFIEELAPVDKLGRLPLLHALGDEAAAHIRRVLPAALAQYPRVVLLTHVPPLREACWYEGMISDDEWAPHFTCQAVGEAALEIMADHPDGHLTILCGHTHSAGQCQPARNVEILTGGAKYGHPTVVRMFEF